MKRKHVFYIYWENIRLSNEVSDTRAIIHNLEHQLKELTGRLANTDTSNHIAKQLGDFTAREISPHIEEGTVYVGSSSTWKDGPVSVTSEGGETTRSFRYKDFPVKFTESFQSPPKVSVMVQDAHFEKNAWAWFRLDSRDVKDGGFTLRCHIEVNHVIYFMRVKWISFP